jgi:hypothetical protein
MVRLCLLLAALTLVSGPAHASLTTNGLTANGLTANALSITGLAAVGAVPSGDARVIDVVLPRE